MQKSTVAAILVFAFIFVVFGHIARAENFVIVKNENVLTTYKVNYSNSTEQAYGVETRTYTGTDVATLKGLNVPEEAWPAFANNLYLIFSSEAFQANKENTQLREQLNSSYGKSNAFEDSRDLYRVLFWVFLIAAIAGWVLFFTKRK